MNSRSEPRTEAGRALLSREDWFTVDDILAIEAEARAPYNDPQDNWRLVRCSTDLLSTWGSRNFAGQTITVEWGERDQDGIWEPVFTQSGTTEAARLAEAVNVAVAEARALAAMVLRYLRDCKPGATR